MKIILVSVLLLLSSCVTTTGSPYGVWKYPSTLVFIEILEDGNVFQCRIDVDRSVITAHGKFDGKKTIVWEPIKIVDVNGYPKSTDFSWQEDEVTVVKNAITLSGPHGAFSFVTTSSDFPRECR